MARMWAGVFAKTKAQRLRSEKCISSSAGNNKKSFRRSGAIFGLAQLPECFVGSDAGSGRQIEGAEFGIGLRDGDAIFADFLMEPIRGAMAFIAKDEPVAVGIFGIPVGFLCPSGKEPQSLRFFRAGLKCFPVVVVVQVEAVPVIHPAAPDLFVGNVETEGMNEMEARVGNRTEPPDVTGVLWDFRIEEDDVQHGEDGLNPDYAIG